MPSDADLVRDEVATWLSENWDPERPLREWREMLADSGWGCPAWPKEYYGRDLSQEHAGVVSREFARAGAVGVPGGAGMSLAAPTLLEFGSHDLKRKLLRPIVTGEHTWCQLFSEPSNGSDLAGLVTRAERSGDEWIVNGQKVWTTGAKTAAYAMLLARTDWEVPKHQGITYFAFPMQQAGVEVRPLTQMNGYASFNEVFLTDARVPHDHIVGELNGGWQAALATLARERAGGGGGARGAAGAAGSRGRGRAAREAAEEAAAYSRTYAWYPQRAGRPDLIRPMAQQVGVNTDPVIRQRIAYLHSLDQINRWNNLRSRASREQGAGPGPQGSLSKLSGTRIARVAARLHAEIVGAAGMLAGPDSPANGTIAEITISHPGHSIAGGTDEIQRNIIGERVLGLPKEPQVDVGVPFREVKVNRAQR